MSKGSIYTTAGALIGSNATVKHRYPTTNSVKKVRQVKMKSSLKEKLRNWLMDTVSEDKSVYVEEDRLQSEGIRLQVYKASGGYVVETRGYDRKTDRSHHTMHVITESEDLGERLGKIIMMEALRG